jgi:ATP/maltotriose-dependent transcriptional regulator MalT
MTDRFIGRTSEIAAVEALLPAPRRPGLRVVQLVGDPGLGKSRLLLELCRRAEAADRLVLSGQATEFERDLPFGLLTNALATHLRAYPHVLAGLAPEVRDELRAVVPGFGEPTATAPDWARYRLYDAVRLLLERLCQPAGLVLVLDDVHWADAASVELLGYLLRQRWAGSLLLTLAYRPRQIPARLPAALAEMLAQPPTVIDLGPLSEVEAAELVGPDVQPLHSQLYAASGGNPLYLLALARNASIGTLPESPDLPAPATLPATIGAEVAALPPVARRVVQAAAVLGERFTFDLLAAVAEVEESDLVGAVDELARRDIVRAESPEGLRFRHPLVRHAAYEDAGAGWRFGAHARAAAAIASGGAPLAVRAHHLERAARVGDETALEVLVRAADQCVWRAPTTASRWYAAALRLLPHEAGDARRSRLLVAHAQALGVAGQLLASRAALHEVLPRLPRSGPLREQAVALSAMTEHLLGQHDQAAALLQRELDGLPDRCGGAAARLRVELAAANIMRGLWTEARRCAEQAVTSARRMGDRGLHAAAAGAIALSEYTVGSLGAARAAADEGALLVDSLSDEELAARLDAVVWLGWAEMFLARYPTALRHQERAVQLARHRGLSHLLTHLLVGQGSALKWLGRLPDALRCFGEAREVALLTGSAELLTMASSMLSYAHTWLGDHPAALRLGREAVQTAGQRRGWFTVLAPAILAGARLEAGDAAGCQQAVLEAAGGADLPSIDPVSRPEWYLLLTRAAVAVGDLVAAREWVERSHASARATRGELAPPAAFAAFAEAELLLAAGSPSEAAASAAEAADQLGAVGNVLDAARARLLAGQALAAAGDRRRALEQLTAAEGVFAACSAAGLRDQTVRELRRLGRRVPAQRSRDGTPPAIDLLTPRESEVARLVAAGRTNREIGRQLFLSEKTIERHLSHIFLKLDVTGRAAVAARVASSTASTPAPGCRAGCGAV